MSDDFAINSCEQWEQLFYRVLTYDVINYNARRLNVEGSSLVKIEKVISLPPWSSSCHLVHAYFKVLCIAGDRNYPDLLEGRLPLVCLIRLSQMLSLVVP